MNLNHSIIELLDLYPNRFCAYSQFQGLSSNTNLTFKYFISFYKQQWQPNRWWNLGELFSNPSITNPQTFDTFQNEIHNNMHEIHKFMNVEIHKIMNVISNSAFKEKDVLKILNSINISFPLLSTEKLNIEILHHLGKNPNITPAFLQCGTIQDIKCGVFHFLSNEHFLPWIEEFLNIKPFYRFEASCFVEKFMSNKALTMDLFIKAYGWRYHDYVKEYITRNPNVTINDFIMSDTELLSFYFYNINANPLDLFLQNKWKRNFYCNSKIANNPHIQMEYLLEIQDTFSYESRTCLYKIYSKHMNLTWEHVVDYSWLSWDWINLSQNSFASSPWYRSVRLMNELQELKIECDYPILSTVM